VVISNSDQELVFAFIEGVTGNVHNVDSRSDVLLAKVARLASSGGYSTVLTYLQNLTIDQSALERFINATTIHTTGWFRECEHFEQLEKCVLERIKSVTCIDGARLDYKVASLGCSSGQEVYSAALVLEKIRRQNKFFEYQVIGVDIDINCLQFAKRAIYSMSEFSRIPIVFQSLVWQGSAETHGLFTLDEEIRKRCVFLQGNLVQDDDVLLGNSFDAILVRNVLLYLSNRTVNSLLEKICSSTKESGRLFVGHSESFLVPKRLAFNTVEVSVFSKSTESTPPSVKEKVLIIEDNETVQAVLEDTLKRVGFSVDCVSSLPALEHYLVHSPSPDIISLDLHMPDFNGEVWLQKFRLTNLHTPVVVISSLFSNDAAPVLSMLSSGAEDYIEKSKLQSAPILVGSRFKALLSHRHSKDISGAAADLAALKFSPELILIGASTGGIKALKQTLQGLPRTLAPVVVVQHISPEYSSELVRHLAKVTSLGIGMTKKTTVLERGHIYIAAGDYHLTIKSRNNAIYVVPRKNPELEFRPSIDVLFSSVDRSLGKKTIAILLTGMGNDGVEGLGKLKRKGAVTVAQDHNTSVVYGMPGEAIKCGYVTFVSEPRKIREFFYQNEIAERQHSSRLA